MDTHVTQAMIRFGLGRRGNEALPANPHAWLLDQLVVADPGPPGPSLAEAYQALRNDRLTKPPPGAPREVGQLFKAEVKALVNQALITATPFRERLVWFWANHFSVSRRGGGGVAAAAPDFIRTAIRPHVTGRFSDMLLAVMRHPAMLVYLDNARSVGPTSPNGVQSGKGLNENLARECLELHTVGTASRYTQADVTSFAKILTGWSVGRLKGDEPSGFLFRPAVHEPGEQTVLGRTMPEGEAGGVAALGFLGTHAETYRHLAAKLVQHFVADTPPPAAVDRIAGVLRDSGGDLGQAARAMVTQPEAWQPLTKLRSPQDFVLATLRAADLRATGEDDASGKPIDAAAVMNGLGQPLFDAPFPIGWPDRAADWAGPEAMIRRVDWAYGFAGRAAGLDPVAVADATLGPLLGADTLEQIRRAGSRRDGLTLLFASPQFQRR